MTMKAFLILALAVFGVSIAWRANIKSLTEKRVPAAVKGPGSKS